LDLNHITVFTGPGQIEMRSQPIPGLSAGEALVRVRACALCTMEQRLWKGAQDDYPIAPGHEAAGIVVDVHPDGAPTVAAGDRVAIAFLDRCMQCEFCRRGETNLCTGKLHGRAPGVFRQIGGLAEYAVVPTWKLFRLPENLSFEEIALCEPVACVIHSIRRADLHFGDDVLVVGGGTMGQLHLQLARLRGARVFLSDPDPQKRQFALEHGAGAVFSADKTAAGVQELTGGIGADTVFVTFGNQDTADQASASIRPGGRIIYYSSFPDSVEPGVNPRRLHGREIVLDGARGQTIGDWHQATRLLAAGLLDVGPLISAAYPLSRINDALDRAIEPSAFRIVVNL
jgi:L-iditol 2-dehydrogenase